MDVAIRLCTQQAQVENYPIPEHMKFYSVCPSNDRKLPEVREFASFSSSGFRISFSLCISYWRKLEALHKLMKLIKSVRTSRLNF